jgi:hypothetical protein
MDFDQTCTYLVLKRIWNPIDFQGQRSRSPGQIFRRGDTPHFALPLFRIMVYSGFYSHVIMVYSGFCLDMFIAWHIHIYNIYISPGKFLIQFIDYYYRSSRQIVTMKKDVCVSLGTRTVCQSFCDWVESSVIYCYSSRKFGLYINIVDR